MSRFSQPSSYTKERAFTILNYFGDFLYDIKIMFAIIGIFGKACST